LPGKNRAGRVDPARAAPAHGGGEPRQNNGFFALVAPSRYHPRMPRGARVTRNTNETQIDVEIDLDGSGRSTIATPLPFLSHMLDQIARHGLFDLTIHAQGDVEIDGHHTTEDVGIALGAATLQALGDKKGIARYGEATLPMDEALATCALDLSGRTYFVNRVPLPKAKLGTWDVELAPVFFEGFARGAQANLHLRLLEGDNLHHIVEICFKAFAKALMRATRIDPRSAGVPSTKGAL
jgi:imidazoleglycerol-phosphate dehydratase